MRNGPFAENARRLPLVEIELMLERSAPDNLPGVACGVLKPSAQQQGVQEQRHDGVLGGPRCRKESRQPTHAAWSYKWPDLTDLQGILTGTIGTIMIVWRTMITGPIQYM